MVQKRLWRQIRDTPAKGAERHQDTWHPGRTCGFAVRFRVSDQNGARGVPARTLHRGPEWRGIGLAHGQGVRPDQRGKGIPHPQPAHQVFRKTAWFIGADPHRMSLGAQPLNRVHHTGV